MPKQVALTIKPHWAYAIFHLGKDIENRSWSLPGKYEGQRIWIHSGKSVTKADLLQIEQYAPEIVLHLKEKPDCLRKGFILGSAVLNQKPSYFIRSKWKMSGFCHWFISDVEPLSTPIPAKGKLGFWDCTELIEN